jgi:hypothetical protein
MAVRGKRTIGVGNPQGGAIGTVGLDTADTPFQTFDVPIFDGKAKALAGMSKGLSAASAMFEDIAKDASNADFLTTSRDLTTTAQDMESSWKASGVSPDPSTSVGEGMGEAAVGRLQGKKWNLGPALGKGANKNWFKATTDFFAVEVTRIKGTEEYTNLTRSDRKAMDELLQKTELSYRAKALLHMQTQTKIHLKAELTTTRDMKKDIAVGDAGNAGVAHSSLANMISSVQEVARMETGATLDDVAVRGAAIEAMDDVAQKSIDNLLNSQDPNRAEKARQWMAMNTTVEVDGHKITLSDDKKNDLNQLIATSVVGEIGRAFGNTLYSKHKDDAAGAQKEIEANNKGYDLKTKQAAQKQYENRRKIVDSQKKRVDTDRYEKAMTDAGNGIESGDAVKARLTGKQRREVDAEFHHAVQMAIEGEVTTDVTVKRKWDGMTDPERAAIDYDVFLVQYAGNMNSADGTRDKVKADWLTARNASGKKKTATEIRLNTLARSMKKSSAGQIKTYFDGRVSARKVRLYTGKSGRDKARRAAFVEAADQEFKERNTDQTPMSQTEADALLDALTARIVIDGDEAMAFNVITEARDEDGDLLRGSEDAARVMSGIEVRDRFEVMQWYRKVKRIGSGEPIKLEDLGEFISKNITLASPPENMVQQLRKALVNNNIEPNQVNISDYYRRWLINKNGRL